MALAEDLAKFFDRINNGVLIDALQWLIDEAGTIRPNQVCCLLEGGHWDGKNDRNLSRAARVVMPTAGGNPAKALAAGWDDSP